MTVEPLALPDNDDATAWGDWVRSRSSEELDRARELVETVRTPRRPTTRGPCCGRGTRRPATSATSRPWARCSATSTPTRVCATSPTPPSRRRDKLSTEWSLDRALRGLRRPRRHADRRRRRRESAAREGAQGLPALRRRPRRGDPRPDHRDPRPAHRARPGVQQDHPRRRTQHPGRRRSGSPASPRTGSPPTPPATTGWSPSRPTTPTRSRCGCSRTTRACGATS